MIAVSRAGKAKLKSLARITASSTQPRRAAARQPSATPTVKPIPTATTPTTIEFWLPTSSCEAMSRPRLSVPSQCANDGAASLFGMSISAGGYGCHSNEPAAASSNKPTNDAPTAKLGCRKARSSIRSHPQPRIDQRIEHVDDEVDRHHHGCQQHDHVTHQDQVAVVDGLEDQAAKAWQHEDVLDDDR